jgi:diphthine-ammonia ligase
VPSSSLNGISDKSSVETEVVIQDDKDFATVAYLRIKSATVQTKTLAPDRESYPPSPSLLDEVGQCVYSSIQSIGSSRLLQKEQVSDLQPINQTESQAYRNRKDDWISIGSLSSGTDCSTAIEDQTLATFRRLKGTKLRLERQ